MRNEQSLRGFIAGENFGIKFILVYICYSLLILWDLDLPQVLGSVSLMLIIARAILVNNLTNY